MLSTYFTNSQNDLQGHLVTWKYPTGISTFPGGPGGTYMLLGGPGGLDKKPGGPATALYRSPRDLIFQSFLQRSESQCNSSSRASKLSKSRA